MLPLVKLTMLNRFWLIVLRAYLVAASRRVNMREACSLAGPVVPVIPCALSGRTLTIWRAVS
jgi:hypothetical protein